MRFSNVAIAGLAHVDGPVRLSTADLAARLAPFLSRIGMPARALQGLSGIAARRFFAPGTTASAIATAAAQQALAKTGVPRERVGALINTSVCRDFVEPSTACLVHGNLGLSPDCLNFDLSTACLGFLAGMDLVAAMIERGAIDYGLVVDGEDSRHVVDATVARLNERGDKDAFRDEFAALTLGSGGAAMLLCRSDLAASLPEAGHRYLGGISLADSTQNHLCRGQTDKMITDSTGLLHAGVALAQRTWDRGCADFGWTPGHFAEFVLHQVSKLHTDKLMATLGLPRERTLPIYPEYGNIGPAAVPMVLSKAIEQGRVRAGDRVALMGIGSGLNCAMAEVLW